MKTEIIIAGFGGQGVLFLGDLIAYCAMKEGKYVTWVPSYGPESRGGTCNCQVICSDQLIGSPAIVHPDVLIVFNQPSLYKFLPRLKTNGTLLYDSFLIKELPAREDIRVVGVPAFQISKMGNMVMMGAFLAVTKGIKPETVYQTLEEKLTGAKAKFIPVNKDAIEKGIKYISDKSLETSNE
ncbi:MAG: 2-oxoacid:acceptor oxidoreductase family protein [Candidatus Desulfofervidaceae bacterium]|nr:2-oxoacid:acceptor oxidoreductase family protein [Candidatus Desulfofervidaceae bacterium]MDL1970296.1 2-oxoacid:acceptor oxidoreductase family protein [Candidatus Desulfofervidaceae bacterium]